MTASMLAEVHWVTPPAQDISGLLYIIAIGLSF